ncbi:MAG: PP2C family protein-serine/threonine phosphatase [Desulfobacterales bacterium]|jgi:serine phosphatase RsbU (regulator of sigma subunit)
MKPVEHVKSYCRFWKPSVARRITFYFLVFGLVVFFITSMLYMGGTRKHFINSTSQLINHQFSLMDSDQIPDFLWKGVGKPNPQLDQLFDILTNLSSSFYAVTDIAIYAKEADDTLWYRMFFDDNKVLRLNPAQSFFSEKLDRNLKRHFVKPGLLARSDDEHALFVNVTGENDLNTYFLKIGIDSDSFAGMMKREAKWIVLVFIITLVLSRFLGYYFARKIARPIENLSEISADVARGDLTHFAPVTSGDEIGELSTNFNKMVEGLREWESVKKIEFELEKGREIQREFLPSHIPDLPNWEIATCFYPAGQVSGDFYDVFMLPDGNVGLVIADVCDKGVGSALYMALFRSLIRVFAEQAIYCTGPELTQIASSPDNTETISLSANDQMARLGAVASTNNYIANLHGRECMYATLFFGVLNPSTGILSYVNGGHEPLYVLNAGNIKDRLKPTGPAVGLMPDIIFQSQEIQLEPGDLLVGYTDGVTEARSPQDEIYTRDRLQSLLTQPLKSASETLERIKTSLFAFIDIAPRSDDVTMLAVQRAAV